MDNEKPGTGEVVQTIVASPLTEGVLGCLSPRNEFLFLRSSKDNYLEVVKFVAR